MEQIPSSSDLEAQEGMRIFSKEAREDLFDLYWAPFYKENLLGKSFSTATLKGFCRFIVDLTLAKERKETTK